MDEANMEADGGQQERQAKNEKALSQQMVDF